MTERFSARERLIRSGIEILSEKGFNSTGLDEILAISRVPRGSFYHYFGSKDAFGLEVADAYSDLLSKKMKFFLEDKNFPPLERIDNYIKETEYFLYKYDFKRGCLIGNISLDLGTINEAFREKIKDTFRDWAVIVDRCMNEAKDRGDLPADFQTMEFANFFWIVWEGVILRARVERSVEPLAQFRNYLFGSLLGDRARAVQEPA